jgi:phospholipase C
MLIVTFDEHGGFYDHQPPPPSVATGDDTNYANIAYSFKFEQLGVRVPAIVISAYTQKGTIIGSDPKDPSTIFDHSSIVATVEKRFGLPFLTTRDAAAKTLEVALNLTTARDDAPTQLPDPAPDSAVAGMVNLTQPASSTSSASTGLSENQKAMSALALACHLSVTDPAYHSALINMHQKLQGEKETAAYIQQVEQTISARRQ